jgi:lambda family phage portal protein
MAAAGSQNRLDKLIAWAAPATAARRMAARGQMALVGSYTGARIDKAQLSRYQPVAGSANSDTIHDLPRLRSRSRDQMRNAPVALGALNTTIGHVIGTGLSYTPAIDGEFLGLTPEQVEEWQDDTKRRFKAWAESPDCDLARQNDFYGLQELGARSWLESGDAFCITPRIQRENGLRLALQLVEADRVCNPDQKQNTDTLIDGVNISPDTGEAISCHVARRHPGGVYITGSTKNLWDEIKFRGPGTGRRNVLHIFKPLRPGQVRGVPWIAPIIEPLKQLDRWSEAELNAAVLSSLNVLFIKMDPTAFGDLYDPEAQEALVGNASKWSGALDSGQAINLMPGESVESPASGRPNPAFDPFWMAMVRQIGMALEIPVEVLTMHFQSSYSAARGALLMAWRAFRSKRDLIAKQFCQPVLELWLADEVAEGRISAPGFFADPIVRTAWCASIWTGDGPGSINPEIEVRAAEARVNLGISTKQAESILHDGVDWEQKHEQRVKEINAEKADGIYIPPAGSPAMPDPAAQADAAKAKEDAATANQANAVALARLSATVEALASKPAQAITIHTPPVEVRAGDVHIAPAAVTVEGHEISVNLPEGCIQTTLEATVQAPNVQVDIPPAQIVIQSPPKQAMHHQHVFDADGNLTATIAKPIES